MSASTTTRPDSLTSSSDVGAQSKGASDRLERRRVLSVSGDFVTRALRDLLRALWFVMIPLLLAGIAFRHLVPDRDELGTGAFGTWLGHVGDRYGVAVFAGFFVVFALLVRYWRFHVPGGRHLSDLPVSLALRLPRRRLYEYSAAAKLGAMLRSPAALRFEPKLDDASLHEFDLQQRNLRAALEVDSPDDVARAHRALAAVARPIVRATSMRETLSFVVLAALAAALALGIRASFFESYRVLSASMLPSLEPGDRIVASKAAYGFRLPWSKSAPARLPRRGDVIVFSRDEGNGPMHVVKRVVGLPGDRISMRGGQPVIAGWAVPTCDVGTYPYLASGYDFRGRLKVEFLGDAAYLVLHTPEERPFLGEYEVKPGEVFVLGDNRGKSADSRSWNDGEGGGLPLDEVDGRATWTVLRTLRNGRVDFREIAKPIGRAINLHGLDVHELADNIERCLRNRPKQTLPIEGPPK